MSPPATELKPENPDVPERYDAMDSLILASGPQLLQISNTNVGHCPRITAAPAVGNGGRGALPGQLVSSSHKDSGSARERRAKISTRARRLCL